MHAAATAMVSSCRDWRKARRMPYQFLKAKNSYYSTFSLHQSKGKCLLKPYYAAKNYLLKQNKITKCILPAASPMKFVRREASMIHVWRRHFWASDRDCELMELFTLLRPICPTFSKRRGGERGDMMLACMFTLSLGVCRQVTFRQSCWREREGISLCNEMIKPVHSLLELCMHHFLLSYIEDCLLFSIDNVSLQKC